MQRYLFKLIVLMSVWLVVGLGCEYDDDDDEDYPGVPPVIKSAELYKSTNTIQQEDNYDLTDSITYWVYGTDADKDIVRVWVTHYHPSDADTPYEGPVAKIVGSMSSDSLSFSGSKSFSGEDPPGTWRMEFQLQDSRGHVSEKIFVDYYRHSTL